MRHMSDEMRQKHEEAIEGQEKVEQFLAMMSWKQKDELDAFHAALCQGVLALCKQTEILLDVVRSYGSHIQEIHRCIKAMQEGTK